ncbi:DUF4179 domain-containing protein [Chengkuizengella axinellae]|uniref:DUF4179 domain-containing protein n=1 Tax=Chengkuizengella axinellae TaxID=3064388 RepID=A0ABT9J1V9_9BACL|nr:DUF4179 domain-containing protein [Chengkuizengella sp. 2205SS18-9]MDP5275577.1 DUF4179 domain-containing protein [Chengkuizengella sp. 2205SS18-9]
MYEQEEKLLSKMKDRYEEIPIPSHIDFAINAGIQKRNKKRKTKLVFTMSALTASILILIFVGSIRVSPTFAMYMNNIPGLSKVIEIINYDKGLQSAVDHGYIQSVDTKDEKDGMSFTVDQVMKDESNLIIFFTINNIDRSDQVTVRETELLSIDGEKIDASRIYAIIPQSEKGQTTLNGRIDYKLEGELPKEFNLQAQVYQYTSGPEWYNEVSTYSLPIYLVDGKFEKEKEMIQIHKTVEIENQMITFDELEIYPTGSVINVRFDPNNSKKIFGFNDLQILDGEGNKWIQTDKNSYYDLDETNGVLYLESSYFENPEELFIEFSSIRALEKEDLDLTIDLTNKTVLDGPVQQISLIEVSESTLENSSEEITKYHSLYFKVENMNNMRFSDLFDWRFSDGDGEEFTIRAFGTSGPYHKSISDYTIMMDENFDRYSERLSEFHLLNRDITDFYSIEILKQEYENPITFKIKDFPTTINEDFLIKIK